VFTYDTSSKPYVKKIGDGKWKILSRGERPVITWTGVLDCSPDW
jgi:hypothetical protein